jgi:hypothetical protein
MPRLIQERKIRVPEDVPTARDVGTENKPAGPVTIPKDAKDGIQLPISPLQ